MCGGALNQGADMIGVTNVFSVGTVDPVAVRASSARRPGDGTGTPGGRWIYSASNVIVKPAGPRSRVAKLSLTDVASIRDRALRPAWPSLPPPLRKPVGPPRGLPPAGNAYHRMRAPRAYSRERTLCLLRPCRPKG
jgi:hypothetical protein